jgi:hypothetical protein
VAVLSAAGIADLNRRRDAVLSGAAFNTNPRVDDPNRRMPYQDSWSFGLAHQLADSMALTADYVGNRSRQQNGVVDINEPVNRVRPGIAVFDPSGVLIPAEARGTRFGRVLQNQSNPAFDANYHSLQVGLQKRMANRWSGRVAYTLQKAHYVGLGNPDTRVVWLDNDIRADYGVFASNRPHVLSTSATVNVWRSLNITTSISAISGTPINETTGRDENGDGVSNNDRPTQGVNDIAALPTGDPRIRSEVDSQGRAIINGLRGDASVLANMSFRYSIPLGGGNRSVDLFFDVFNLTNKENLSNPSGNRNSSQFLVPNAAGLARQSQFGARVRF